MYVDESMGLNNVLCSKEAQKKLARQLRELREDHTTLQVVKPDEKIMMFANIKIGEIG